MHEQKIFYTCPLCDIERLVTVTTFDKNNKLRSYTANCKTCGISISTKIKGPLAEKKNNPPNTLQQHVTNKLGEKNEKS